MAEVIKKVKGFVNKKGDKFELEPSAHTHTCSEILGLDDKIQEYDSNIESLSSEKMNKVLTASEGHVAVFNNEGQVIDGGDALEMDKISKNNNLGQKCTVECYISDSPNISLKIENRGSNKVCDINLSNIDNLKRALENPVKTSDTTPAYSDGTLITSGAVEAAIQNALANIGLRNIVSALPNLSEVSEGDEYLYIGQSVIGKEFGQTYKCESKLCGDVILSANSQDGQELDGFLNHAKTMQTVTGGKYIMTGYSYEQNVFKLDVRIFPNSASVNFTELTTNVLAAFNASAQEQLDIDQHGDNSATVKKVWTPKYKQELIPFYQV